ncbi:MAG: hypothetical protein V6Z82_06950, partial [Flavobacteriales bacterium]
MKVYIKIKKKMVYKRTCGSITAAKAWIKEYFPDEKITFGKKKEFTNQCGEVIVGRIRGNTISY